MNVLQACFTTENTKVMENIQFRLPKTQIPVPMETVKTHFFLHFFKETKSDLNKTVRLSESCLNRDFIRTSKSF